VPTVIEGGIGALHLGARKVGAAALLLCLASCDGWNFEWQGWVYPNGADLTRDVAIGRFQTAEECRRSAQALLANFNVTNHEDGSHVAGDYECGRACKKSGELGGLNVCAETTK